MTTVNVWSRLKAMIPPSPLLIGKVLELHADDDTSTIQLLMNGGSQTYDEALQAGNIIRARGQFVPVGQNAFVRDGVIETKAPDDLGGEIVVGRVVTPGAPLTFSPDFDDQSIAGSVPFSFSAASHWHGGIAPLRYSVGSGALPAGLSIDSVTGAVGGAPTGIGPSTFTLRATDASATYVDSNDTTITVGAGKLIIGRFDGSNANGGQLGGTFTITSARGSVSALRSKFGSGSLRTVQNTVDAVGTAYDVCTYSHASADVAAGTKRELSGWVFFESGVDTPSTGFSTTVLIWEETAGTIYVNFTPTDSAHVLVQGWVGTHKLSEVEVLRDAWYHASISVDESGVCRWFLNGVLQAGTFALSGVGGSPRVAVMRWAGTGSDCYVDDLCAEVGSAHVADFTPPGAL